MPWNEVRTGPKDSDGSFYQNPSGPGWTGYMEYLPGQAGITGTGPWRVDQSGNITAQSLTGGAVLIPPSGDQSGNTDITAINNVLAAGGAVQLGATNPANVAGQYWINSPILPASLSRLRGVGWSSATDWDNYSAGTGNPACTIINVAAGFSGTAFINMPNSTLNQYFGVDISEIYLNGENYSGGAHGIYVDGAWGACALRYVTVHRLHGSASALYMTADGLTGNIPDEWLIEWCKFDAAYGTGQPGVYLNDLADSIIIGCRSSNHNGDAWQIARGVNSKLIGCKGENSQGAGFHLTGMPAAEQIELCSCSTNACQQDGFLFDGSASSGLGTYTLTGCRSSGDGQAGGTTYAGFRANGAKARIAATGCTVNKNATGPAYGASETSSSYGMCHTGSYLEGVTAATHDDGSNTHVLVSQSPVPF